MSTIVGYRTEDALTPLPADAFDENGVAVLVASGGRYGGEWLVNLLHGPIDDATVLGSVWTEATDDPDVAARTVEAWLTAELPSVGLKIALFICHNDKYGPSERQYFTTSQVCIVDKDWK